MKPTNYNEQGCDPMSSNCVIWQGPDIECIGLCKNDSITKVVAQLATKLCDLMDMFNVTNFDLSCLSENSCGPANFTELINILIGNICETENIPVTPTPTPNPGLDTTVVEAVVPINKFFYYKNETGDIVKTMPVSKYAVTIANSFVETVGEVKTMSAAVISHEKRITKIEEKPEPTLELPKLYSKCMDAGCEPKKRALDEMVKEIDSEVCLIRSDLGSTESVFKGLQAMCFGINTADRLSSTGKLSDSEKWHKAPKGVGESIENIWAVICDMSNAIKSIQLSTGNKCSDIDVRMQGITNNTTGISIYFVGTLPSNYTDAGELSSIHLVDKNGFEQFVNGIRITSYLNTGNPFLIMSSGGLDTTNNINMTLTKRFEDPTRQSTCESVEVAAVLGTQTCPLLTVVPTYTKVDVQFTWNGSLGQTIIAQLLDVTGTNVLQSKTVELVTSNMTYSFSNLIEGGSYKTRLVIDGTPCEETFFTALSHPCAIPVIASLSVDYVDVTGTTDGGNIEAWLIEYNNAHP